MDGPTETSTLAVCMAKHPGLLPLMAGKSSMPKQGHRLHYYYTLHYILLLYIIVINILFHNYLGFMNGHFYDTVA